MNISHFSDGLRQPAAGGLAVAACALIIRRHLSFTKGRAMALMDFIKKQFIDIIEWTDVSRDTLSWRFPD